MAKMIAMSMEVEQPDFKPAEMSEEEK